MSSVEPKDFADSVDDRTERRRTLWQTAWLVIAILAVWAVGLGVLDRSRPEAGSVSFQTSPSARVERRPALFAITWNRSGANAGPGTIGVATPIALVEPGGAIVAPITARTDEDALAEGRAFASTYCKPSTGLMLLRGGAEAGDVRFVGDPTMVGSVPVVPVAGSGPLDLGPLDVETTAVLAISDRRFAGRSTGVRPMRDEHRSAVDAATRQILRDRYPTRVVVDEGLARVRVADLDRDGRTEILATREVRLRDESGGFERVAVFMIAEPERAQSATKPGYRVVFVGLQLFRDAGPAADIVFIDQADLTAAEFDEVIVRLDDGETSRYAILRRDQTTWTQVSSTRPMRQPGLPSSAGE